MQDAGISIVIPAYNEENFLPGTLASVNQARKAFRESSGHSSEVIVVDNASIDQTEKVARANGAVVINHEIRNIASVRNSGIHAAKYSIIVAIDADCFLPADALIKVWQFMKDEHYIGAALGVTLLSKNRVNKFIAAIIQSLATFASGIYGGMFVFRREDAVAIGGFPEDRMIAEDAGFATLMKAYAKKHNKKFGSLKSVQVSTLDRKNIGLLALPALVFQVAKAFAGAKQKPDDLKFWYDPDR